MSDLVIFQPVRAWDRNGAYAPGALATFFEPGTTTARTVYSDAALTVEHPSPLVADASGVFPAVYTDGPVKVVITNAAGVALPKSPMDPAFTVPASTAAAASISFAPTGEIPVTNVQAAIARVQENMEDGLADAGWTVTESVDLLANLDSTSIASGAYRFAAATTGTRPADWSAGDEGVVLVLRETATAALMLAASRDDGFLWKRQMASSAWGAWTRLDVRTQDQATWNAAAGTVESAITPAKLAAAIDHRKRVYQVSDRKTSGTNGGGTTGTTWATRDLNTVDVAGISGVTLVSNVVTGLPAGRYRAIVEAQAYRIGGHRVRLYNVTGAAELLRGTNAHSQPSADTSETVSRLDGEFTLGATSDVRVEHWAEFTRGSDGFGRAVSDGGSEVYTVARFEWLGAS